MYLCRGPMVCAVVAHEPRDPRDGAVVEFVGVVRMEEAGQEVDALDYEAYEPMAERVIGRLVAEARDRWPLHGIEVQHRVGQVPVGAASVRIRVCAPHRAAAFAACRFLIDQIKEDAPIWKQACIPCPT